MARIHVLGAGTPTPTPSRFGSSYVVEACGERIMVDCGPAATHKLVKAGLWPTEIDYLFFTHHHFDHDVDYPCFLLTRWDQSIGKENRLQVYGPSPTERFTEGIMGENGVFAHDWKARVNHPVSQQVFVNRGGVLPRKPPDILAKDVAPGRVYSGSDWEMTGARAEHVQPYLDSLAYRLDSPEGKRRIHRRHGAVPVGCRPGRRRRRHAVHVLGRPGGDGAQRRGAQAVRHHGGRADGAGGGCGEAGAGPRRAAPVRPRAYGEGRRRHSPLL